MRGSRASRGGSRLPCGTIRALRLPAVRPAAFRFLRPAVPSMRPRRFAPAGPANARPAGLGLLRFGQPTPRCVRRKRRDLPSSWGTPIAPSPGSSTPAGPRASDPSRRPGAAPVAGTSRAPALRLSRLNPPASVLAVYASPRRSPAKDARLASGCWSGSTGRALTRRVPVRGFRVCPYISSSSPKLAWRNPALGAPAGGGAEVSPVAVATWAGAGQAVSRRANCRGYFPAVASTADGACRAVE